MARRKVKANDLIEWALVLVLSPIIVALFNLFATMMLGSVFTPAVLLTALGFLVYYFHVKKEEDKHSLLFLFGLMFPVAGIVQMLSAFWPIFAFSVQLGWFSFASLMASVLVADLLAEFLIDVFIDIKK